MRSLRCLKQKERTKDKKCKGGGHWKQKYVAPTCIINCEKTNDMHAKSMKHLQSDYHNPRNNPMTQMFQGTLQKKSAWNQPQQQLPPLQIPTSSSHHQQQMQFLQVNYLLLIFI